MQALFATGHAVDIVLAVLVVEAVWLRVRGRNWADIAPALVPAILMMLGLRAALLGWHWPWIAAPLALAFPVHLIDLKRRGMLARKPQD